MSRRSLVADFSPDDGPVTTFDDAKDCTDCSRPNVGIRAPDGTPYCREHFAEAHPDLVDRVEA